jgi:hypothetical protein
VNVKDSDMLPISFTNIVGSGGFANSAGISLLPSRRDTLLLCPTARISEQIFSPYRTFAVEGSSAARLSREAP